MTEFAVVGCPNCDFLWVIESFRTKDRIECPRCTHTKVTTQVRPKAEADEWEVACELRSRILAVRADCDWYIDEKDDYGVLATRLEEALPSLSPPNAPLHSDLFKEELEDVSHWGDVKGEILRDEAEAYLDRRFATYSTPDPAESIDRSFDHFENKPGTIQVRQEIPLHTDARFTVDCPPGEFWERVARNDAVQAVLVDAVRELLADASHPYAQTLLDAGVTAADSGHARLLTGLDQPAETDAHQDALEFIASIGQNGVTQIGHRPLEEVATGPLALLDAVETTPTIAVQLGQEFCENENPSQREDLLWLLSALSQVVDLHVCSTGLTVNWLLEQHPDDVPTAFSESDIAHRGTETTIEEDVSRARQELELTGRCLDIVRKLAVSPGETLQYSELCKKYDVSASRISQHLGELERLNLIDRTGSGETRQVSLLPAGIKLLNEIETEIGRQQQLDEAFSGSAQDQHDSRVSARTRGTPRPRCPPLHTLDWLDRPLHAPIAAAAPDGGVGLVEHPVFKREDRSAPLASYNEIREELLVGAEYDNPMAWMTSTALALVNPTVFTEVELEDRLQDEAHAFQDFFGSWEIPRDARCLGWLSDDVETGDDFLEALLDGRETLLSLTQQLRDGEYDDESRFRGEILRLAHGLAGTAVHLYDMVDIDVGRFLWIPRFKELTDSKREDLLEVLAVHSAITSRYGHTSAYRALFEERESHRKSAILPNVDASDPFGQLIGGITLLGPDIDDIQEDLRESLSEPRDVVEEAPEFSVPIPVETPDRPAYVGTLCRVFHRKGFGVPSEVVTILQSLTGSVLDVARAAHSLRPEDDEQRDIRVDELRYALGSLPTERLLPETKPTVSRLLKALLAAERPLSKKELTEKADVSRSSMDRHHDKLESIALVTECEGGYRLDLSFATTEERGTGRVPHPVANDGVSSDDLLFEMVIKWVSVSEAGRIGDPADPLARAFTEQPEYDGLREEIPWIDPWIRLSKTLCEERIHPTEVAEFGPTIEQTPLDA